MALPKFSPIVRLNVGGTLFMTSRDTLCKNPDTMLGRMFGGELQSRTDEQGAYFIDRDPKHFRAVLNFLRDGRCALPPADDHVARQELLQEASFFGLEGLVAALQPAGVRLRARIASHLFGTTQHKRVMQILWEVAFQEPYEPSQLCCGTTVRITASPGAVSFRGPVHSLIFSEEEDKGKFDDALGDVRYLIDSPDMVQAGFSRMGLHCTVLALPHVWAPSEVPCTLTLSLNFKQPSLAASHDGTGAGLGHSLLGEAFEDELLWL